MFHACICLAELQCLIFVGGKKSLKDTEGPNYMRENMKYFCVKWNQYVEISARERFKKDENTKHRRTCLVFCGTLAQLRMISNDQCVSGHSVALCYNNNDLCRSFAHVLLSIISINPRPCLSFFALSVLPQDSCDFRLGEKFPTSA